MNAKNEDNKDMAAKKQAKPRAIDLFSGSGGLTTGLKQAGFKVVGAIEYEQTACETYKMNHPEVGLVDKKIEHVDPTQYMNQLGLERGDLELLAGCPPCQGFSTIGTRNRGNKDDVRNDYIFQVFRFAQAFFPKTIMVENVPALAKDWRMDDIKAQLRELGYGSIEIKVLNAAEYSVPQSRRRMILLCSRLGELRVREHKGKVKLRTVRDAIGGLPIPGNTGDPLHDYPEKRSEKVLQRISMIPKDGGSRTDLSAEWQLECHKKSNGFKDVYGRMAWDKPSPTMTGGCSNPSKGRFLHPEQNRTITLREAALLQTFPKTYKFSLRSGKQGVAVMIGNALPPTLIKYHAREIVKHLSEVV